MVKYDSFQIYRVHPDRVIQKTWQLMTNLKTSEFDLSHIKQCVKKKKIFVRHIKVAKQLLNSTFFKKIQKQPLEVQKQSPEMFGGALKNLQNFKGKQLRWSLFHDVASLQPAAFFKKRLKHKRFHVKFNKLLRIPILRYICKRLLLEVLIKKAVLTDFAKFTGRKKAVVSVP